MKDASIEKTRKKGARAAGAGGPDRLVRRPRGDRALRASRPPPRCRGLGRARSAGRRASGRGQAQLGPAGARVRARRLGAGDHAPGGGRSRSSRRWPSGIDGRGTIAICDAPHTLRRLRGDRARAATCRDALERVRARWPALRLEVLDLRREGWSGEGGGGGRAPRRTRRTRAATCGSTSGATACSTATAAKDATTVRTTTRASVNAHHRGDVHEYLIAGLADGLRPVHQPAEAQDAQEDRDHLLPQEPRRHQRRQELAAAPHRGRARPTAATSSPTIAIGQRIEARLEGGTAAWAASRMPKCRHLGLPQGAQGRRPACSATARPTIRNGNWQGNDTCWRMALDLNRALLYGEPRRELARGACPGLPRDRRRHRRRRGQRPAVPDRDRLRRDARRFQPGGGRHRGLPPDGLRAARRCRSSRAPSTRIAFGSPRAIRATPRR